MGRLWGLVSVVVPFGYRWRWARRRRRERVARGMRRVREWLEESSE